MLFFGFLQDIENSNEIGNSIEKTASELGRDVVVIASTDFTHLQTPKCGTQSGQASNRCHKGNGRKFDDESCCRTKCQHVWIWTCSSNIGWQPRKWEQQTAKYLNMQQAVTQQEIKVRL